jgi:myo-inositol-1(or 4)-monophosphatase
MGSNALSLASVGAGRVLATAIGAFGPHDCFGGTLIAREAGARVVFRSGREDASPGDGVLCAAPGVADELQSIWEEAGPHGD